MVKTIITALLVIIFAVACIVPRVITINDSDSLEKMFNNKIVDVSDYMDEKP